MSQRRSADRQSREDFGEAVASSARAAVFTAANRPLAIESFAWPSPGPGEALVAVDCCTLCGSDLHTLAGRRATPVPTILGHETVGHVAAVSRERVPTDTAGVPLRLGERVVWSVTASCGDCDRCRRGFPNKCRRLWKYGHERIEPHRSLSGGLGEICYLRAGTAIVRLRDRLSDEEACPASCATATAAEAFRQTGTVSGRSVLIFGAGMLGLTASAMAAHRGAARIVVCDTRADRLRRASDFGATETIQWNSGTDELAARLGPEGVDAVLEMSGAESAVAAALASLGIGGVLVLVGSVFPSNPVGIDPERIIRRLLRIVGVHNYTPASLAEAIEFLEQTRSRFPFGELVGPTFTLANVDAAVAAASHPEVFRVAVRPRG